MVNLSTQEQKRASLTMALLIGLRIQGLQEKEIEDVFRTPATQRDSFDSLERLYAYLLDRGFPRWCVYGEDGSGGAPGPLPEKTRKVRGVDDTSHPLPSAARAAVLFEVLAKWVEREAKFVAELVESRRGNLIETWWDASDGKPAAMGISKAPVDPLWRLIGMYALADEQNMFGGNVVDMELIVRALHPEGENEDIEEILKNIYRYINGWKTDGRQHDGLKTRAKQIAQIVRGGKLKRGRTDEVSAEEQSLACVVSHTRRSGLSDKQARDAIDDGRYGLGEIKRLGGLRLDEPELDS